VAAGLERLRYAVPGGGALTRDYAGAMAAYVVGAQTFWGNYGRARRGTGSSAAGTTVNAVQNLPGSGASMWTLGVQVRLSAQTRLYAFYNELDNDTRGLYTFDPALAPQAGRGSRLSARAHGMQKRF
jgi:hypothetical protein